MDIKSIPIESFLAHPFRLWEPDWLLLTSGDFTSGQFNCMTISWGSIGVIWGRPFIQVVVRPQRYTFKFIEQYTTFTVCAFPRQYRKALNILGTKSGQYTNKIAEAGLTPQAALKVTAPSYKEAELVFECSKIYASEFEPRQFLDPTIDQNYSKKDYHHIYYGTIVHLSGTEKYMSE